MDTLTRTMEPDTLVLSLDQRVERITEEQFAINSITSGGQLPDYAPTKLVSRKERLYNFNQNGKFRKSKIKGLFTKKKFDPWYFRVE